MPRFINKTATFLNLDPVQVHSYHKKQQSTRFCSLYPISSDICGLDVVISWTGRSSVFDDRKY